MAGHMPVMFIYESHLTLDFYRGQTKSGWKILCEDAVLPVAGFCIPGLHIESYMTLFRVYYSFTLDKLTRPTQVDSLLCIYVKAAL